MRNALSTRVGLVFGRLGTFWTRVFGDKDHVLTLLNMAHVNSFVQGNESELNMLAGQTQHADLVANVTVKFAEDDIYESGDLFYDHSGLLYDGQATYSNGNEKYWLLPVNSVLPQSIQTATGGKLLAGIDFYVYKQTWLFFRQNPLELFADKQYIVASGRKLKVADPLAYVLKLDAPSYYEVVQYVRNNQSAKQLERALAEIAGLKVLRATQTLTFKQTENGVTTYGFPQQVFEVDYEHEELTLGQTYPAGYIIGDAVRVHSYDASSSWWHAVDWNGGISLSPLTNHKTLHVKDEDTVAYGAGIDADGKIHARMLLQGNDEAEMAYWAEVAAAETRTGKFLNDVIGLTTGLTDEQFQGKLAALEESNKRNRAEGVPLETFSPAGIPGAKLVNPLDVLFTAALTQRTLIITIDQAVAKNQAELFKFLGRELPIGVVAVVLAYSPFRAPDVFDVSANSVDAAVFNDYTADAIQSPTDTFSFAGNAVDFVQITAQTS